MGPCLPAMAWDDTRPQALFGARTGTAASILGPNASSAASRLAAPGRLWKLFGLSFPLHEMRVRTACLERLTMHSVSRPEGKSGGVPVSVGHSSIVCEGMCEGEPA